MASDSVPHTKSLHHWRPPRCQVLRRLSTNLRTAAKALGWTLAIGGAALAVHFYLHEPGVEFNERGKALLFSLIATAVLCGVLAICLLLGMIYYGFILATLSIPLVRAIVFHPVTIRTVGFIPLALALAALSGTSKGTRDYVMTVGARHGMLVRQLAGAALLAVVRLTRAYPTPLVHLSLGALGARLMRKDGWRSLSAPSALLVLGLQAWSVRHLVLTGDQSTATLALYVLGPPVVVFGLLWGLRLALAMTLRTTVSVLLALALVSSLQVRRRPLSSHLIGSTARWSSTRRLGAAYTPVLH
jgi:hypothetical protein